MGKWLDRVIEKKESKDKNYRDMPRDRTDIADIVAAPDKLLEGGIDFVGHLTDAEREYYCDLLEIMQSPKFGMDRETAKQEARTIVDEYHLRKKQRLERMD